MNEGAERHIEVKLTGVLIHLAISYLHVEDGVVAELVDGLLHDHLVAALLLEHQNELEELVD